MNATWNFIATNWVWVIANIVFDPLALYFIIVLLAELDIIFTKVIEGTCKGIVKAGQLVRFPIQYADHYIDSLTGEVREYGVRWRTEESRPLLEILEAPPDETKEQRQQREEKNELRRQENTRRTEHNTEMEKRQRENVRFAREEAKNRSAIKRLWCWLFGGIRLLGIPFVHSLWEYTITFIRKGAAKPEPSTYNYINLAIQNFNTPPKIVRTSERIGVKIEYALLLRTKNPRKAMVEPRPNFLQTVDDLIDAALRVWASSKLFDEVMKVREEAKGRELEQHLIGQVGQDILDHYGIEIVNIAIKNVGPEKDDIIEAIELQFEATKRLEASRKEAESIAAIGEAHAGVAKKVLQSTEGKTADEVVAASMLLDAQKGTGSNSELASSRKTAVGLVPLAEKLGKAIRGDRP